MDTIWASCLVIVVVGYIDIFFGPGTPVLEPAEFLLLSLESIDVLNYAFETNSCSQSEHNTTYSSNNTYSDIIH